MVKGPKVLNPADKARREARKKELKKNKKQRQQVRSAVIESKDPDKIVADLEALDKVEFDPSASTSAANDLILKEKRKRLNESWARILAYYQKEDADKYSSLKKLESDYESRHKASIRDFESIRAAQEVKIEDVFLPPDPDADLDEIPDDDPLMSEKIYVTPLTEGMTRPPGCPPGMPPDFKQLVESLKSSLATPLSQAMPQNLLNLALQRNKPRRGRPKDSKEFSRIKQIDKSRAGREETPKSTTKSAVIESKPVIFMPKATKFVPASVRSKVSRDGHKDTSSSKD